MQINGKFESAQTALVVHVQQTARKNSCTSSMNALRKAVIRDGLTKVPSQPELDLVLRFQSLIYKQGLSMQAFRYG